MFDDVLDDYLEAERAKRVYIPEIMDTGSSRHWARPNEAGKKTDKKADGDAAGASDGGDDDGESSDSSIEEHPFFDGLKEKPKEKEWDAETILSTYTTTEHHPTLIRTARRPKRGEAAIQLDPRTGLPVGTMLPAEEARRRAAGAGAQEGGADDDDELEYYGAAEGVNLGAARDKKEAPEEKRARKAAAKAAKAERRVEKKGTKEAFREERALQKQVAHKTAQLPQQSLSRWG